MAYRTLEITFISAKDLPDVNLFSKMDVYVVASIDGDSRSTQRTPTDQDGGKSPSWNSVHRFSIPADPNFASNLILHVVLRSERALGDRDVGDLRIPLKDLVNDSSANSGKPQFVSYQVHKACSGKSKGVLNISYKFLEPPVTAPVPPAPAGYPVAATEGKHESKHESPVTAYPAAAAASASAYPPPGAVPPNYSAPPPGYGAPPPVYGAPPPGYPQQPYGYGAPPAPGYGYPPQQYQQPGYGYGAPPPVVKPAKHKKNKFGGLGLGAGIGAGLLGGLIVGDLVGDAVEDTYDAGYDAGFDDGGGFDF